MLGMPLGCGHFLLVLYWDISVALIKLKSVSSCIILFAFHVCAVCHFATCSVPGASSSGHIHMSVVSCPFRMCVHIHGTILWLIVTEPLHNI
jgi:hypothetical protein